ncbi:hypothetical protein QTL95_21915 [Rhizobium sp. S152]|uniref:hypothetical protein n=1 Tax=Rhizobium sp. S152 TaxID=3055038 RepID=UPI0025A9DE70|nr:hypothetical protein [Rhizobium sp. S152]MDM9628559.1 hypothetical protein [Rhizobium sp. S152]
MEACEFGSTVERQVVVEFDIVHGTPGADHASASSMRPTRTDVSGYEASHIERLNKLYIIQAAIEDMVDNDLRVTTEHIVQSDDVQEIMSVVEASALSATLTITTLDGMMIGEVHLEDAEHHSVFGRWETSLARELDRAFELIEEANECEGYLGDNPFL